MKRSYFYFSALSALLFLTVVLNSCKKKVDNVSHTPAAGLLTFNLALDKTVAVTIDGSNLLSFPLGYASYSAAYQGVYIGPRTLTSYDYNTSVAMANVSGTFVDSSYYSLFVVGVNGNYKNLLVKDNLDSLSASSGQAYVRYINAIPDSANSSTVRVTANGSDIFNDVAPYTTVSGFKGVTPGTISVNVTNNADSINVSRIITVAQNQVYTLLVSGLPAQTDTTKAVQIRYIINGALTP